MVLAILNFLNYQSRSSCSILIAISNHHQMVKEARLYQHLWACGERGVGNHYTAESKVDLLPSALSVSFATHIFLAPVECAPKSISTLETIREKCKARPVEKRRVDAKQGTGWTLASSAIRCFSIAQFCDFDGLIILLLHLFDYNG